MGGLTSIVGAALPVLQLTRQVADQVSADKKVKAANKMAGQQLADSQALAEAYAVQNANIDRQQLVLTEENDVSDKKQSLREQQAALRAKLGALGILSTGGSGDVIARNLLEQTNNDLAVSDALVQLKKQAIDSNVSQLQQRDLLERAQLAEKQRLASLYSKGLIW